MERKLTLRIFSENRGSTERKFTVRLGFLGFLGFLGSVGSVALAEKVHQKMNTIIFYAAS
ncbi:hypothetical protein KKI90_13370 [Xenorhabdus bovienii]|uniref:hypothetical protein n=1 Tax=Xenorhabdus bovienii TaxID=40576 RepID=UPI00237D0728|nr:hypothetical protein [Xenorhabdus bovienii]MDE1487356.1 hypothetical protein [Xenorhabdus bovienii]MDE9478205.1 hypothetical protein [Xenorhabdus bovienii]MDE9530984.1 hypothetical protein [Xenorhabdus bovienii]